MKRLVFFIFLLAIFVIPIKVFAISGTVNLNCSPASAFVGDAINCTIAGDVSDGSIKEYAGTIELSDNLQYVSGSASSGWKGTLNNNIVSLTTDESKSDSFEIAGFIINFKSDATSNGTVTLKTTKFGEISDVEDKTVNITLSTNVTDTSDGKTPEDTNTDIKNPETGSNIPFIVIGSCILVTIIVYEIAARKKKLHKI